MYLGIDFGTSFSKAATLYLSHPLLLAEPGEYGLASEFYYDRDCGVLVGSEALDAGQGSAAANLVSEVKMAILERRSYTLDGRTFSVEEIVREIYRTLLRKAIRVARTRSLDPAVEGAVISVPTKFGMLERGLIHQAAATCMGEEPLPVLDIIREPVAAALAYYHTEPELDRRFLVYDLGGGTCDIALVESDRSRRERYVVVDSDMVRRGGRDWDRELERYLTEILEEKTGARIGGNVGCEEKIRRAAITVKHQLSDPARERSVARVEINGRIHSVPVTRTAFEEITEHLLRETLDCLRAFYDAHGTDQPIDEIICVGGSSNMPQVEEGIRQRFPGCRVRVYEPEHAVVYGAAIYADLIRDEPIPGIVLREVSAFSYGVEIFDDYENRPDHMAISNILLKGSELPAQAERRYCPARDGQTSVDFDVFESESEAPQYEMTEPTKRYIGTASLALPPDAPKTLRLTCRISLNGKGLLEVSAWEPSGRQVRAQFRLQGT